MATITEIQLQDGSVHQLGGGGGGETYTLTKSGNTITLAGSGGDLSSVTDADTTYTFSLSGNTLTITPSGGTSQTITLPDDNTTYSISISGNVVTLTGSDGSTDSITIPNDNTTYTLSISGNTLTLTPSVGTPQSVTLPDDDTTYTISISGNTLTLTPSIGTAQEITLPIPTKTSDLANDSGFITGMTLLSYGNSTWDDFITAYNANKVVYCRASSNSNPATGSQTRLAFMAYVNNGTTPTEVEFQYYRSVSSHTISQQGDQVYVYKLNKTNGWSVTVRQASSKVVAGSGLASSYSNGTLTLTAPPDSTKQDLLESGTNIKTINGESILGSGDLVTPDENTTYTISVSGHTVTLTGSDGSTSTATLPDDNTIYTIAVDGYQIVLTDSDGYSQRVTIPSGMFIVDESNTLDEICGAYNDDRVVYYQYWANVSTLRLLPLAEIDCSDHALFAQIINDGTDTYLLIAMVDENDDWSTSAIPIETTDTTYTISISSNDITLTPSSGTAQTITLPIPTKTSDLTNDSDFVSDANYVHTDNNFTTAEKNKLSGIQSGAEVNVQANWNQSDSTADDYIKNKPTIPTPPSPSSTTPKMDGTASVGSETNYARGDHRHPSDTSKQNTLVSGTNIKTINGNSILGSGDLQVGGSVISTDVPTADTIAEWDSDAHMNSEDMTSQEVDDFVDGLNVSGGGWVYVPLTSGNPSIYTNPAGGYYKLGRLVVVQCRFYVAGTFPSSDYNTVTSGLPVPSEIQVSLGVTWNYADSATHASAVVSSTGSLVVQSGSKALTASTLFITGAYIAE